MAYQFFHIETYSEAPKKVRGTTDHYNTAEQVEEEARRTPAYSEHVEAPLAYHQLPNTMPIDDFIALRRKLVAAAVETVTSGATTYQRRLRADTATLYTEIHSHPIRSKDYIADMDALQPEVTTWLQHLSRDFKKRMPKGVVFTAVVHLDESHLHVHILAINADDPKLDANKLHAGKRAAAEYRGSNGSDAITSLPKPDLEERPKKPKKPRPSKNRVTQKKNDAQHAEEVAAWEAECAPIDARNARRLEEWEKKNKAHLKAARDERGANGATKAYNAAMRKVQDDYYEAVGKPCGLLRHGPRQARKSTKQYAAEQRQAKLMAEEMERLERKRREQAASATALAAREVAVAAIETALAERQAEHEAGMKALGDQRAAQARAEDEMQKSLAAQAKAQNEKENELRSREAELTGAMDAIGQVLDAVESGEAEVVDGDIHMPKWPNFLRRVLATAAEDAPSAPVMKLVRRFMQLVVRGREVAQGAEGPSVQDDGLGLGA